MEPSAQPVRILEDIPNTVAQYFIPILLKSPPEIRYAVQNMQIMLLYFSLESLDVNNELHHINHVKSDIIDHIYSLQINKEIGGFLPSSAFVELKDSKYQLSHIVFTYSALNCLKILGDDLSRVNKKSLIRFIQSCRRQDGAFSSFEGSQEYDLRFIYAAICICAFINDFSAINLEKTLQYIEKCHNYDGGYGLRPNSQTHSGGIYTALASLKILGKIDQVISKQRKHRILHYLVSRQTFNLQAPQIVGIQGRVGKLPDSCYTFWVGASISILTGKNLLNPNISKFLDLCHMKNHSYAKYPFMQKGDPQHTLHSIVGRKIILDQAQQLCLQKGIKKSKI